MRLHTRQRKSRRRRILLGIFRAVIWTWGILSLLAAVVALPQLSALYSLNRVAGALDRAEIVLNLSQRRLAQLGLSPGEAKSLTVEKLRQLDIPATVEVK